MWQLLLLAAAGTVYLARCLQTSSRRRPVLEEEESKRSAETILDDRKQYDEWLSQIMPEQTGTGFYRNGVQGNKIDLNSGLNNADGFKRDVGSKGAFGLQAHSEVSNAGLGEDGQILDESKDDVSYSQVDVQASGGVSREFMFRSMNCSSLSGFNATTVLPQGNSEGRSDKTQSLRKAKGLTTWRGRGFSGRASAKGVSQRFKSSLQSCLDAQSHETDEGIENRVLNPCEVNDQSMKSLRRGKAARVGLTVFTAEQSNHEVEHCNVGTQSGRNVCEREDITPRTTQCLQDVKGFQFSDHRSSCSELCKIEHVQKRRVGKKFVPAFQKKRKMPWWVEYKSGASGLDGHPWNSEGALLFSYGVGIGAMFMISSGKGEIDKLTTLLNHTVDLVQEIKGQLDARNEYLQNTKPSTVYQGTLFACQEPKLTVDAKLHVQRESTGGVATPFQAPSENNESATSVITEEPEKHVTEMAELEAEFQAELEHIQVNMCRGNFSNHRRKISGLSELDPESLIDVVEGELHVDGLPDYCDSVNKTPSVQLENTHLDNCGVSPYELDKHLRDLLEKQQEKKISELETELKSTETKLYTKERELQWWKDHVRRLTELSFGATSGEDSSTFERANDADGTKCAIGASMKTSVKSIISSEQEGKSQLSPWPFSHRRENPLESTADSLEHVDHRGKMANRGSGATSLDYVENMEHAGMIPDFRASVDETCMDFLKAVADARSDTCCRYDDDTSEPSIEPELSQEYAKPSEASSSCTVLDHIPDWKSEAEYVEKKKYSASIISMTSESLDIACCTQRWSFQTTPGVMINQPMVNDGTGGFEGPVNKCHSNWPVSLDGHNVYSYSNSEDAVHVVQKNSTENCKELNQCFFNYTNSSKFSSKDPEIDPLVLDKVNSWKAWNGLPQ